MSAIHEFDVVSYLKTPEDIAAYINAAMEEGDPQLLSAALGDVARAQGMTNISRTSGITRDGLYKALRANGNPSFATVCKVLEALGLKFSVKASA